ncbi:hypothetical protein CKO36_09415 [Rhabdochromatium marinum]|nr:hypothetical protein [Rhabdochromatium marinum]
MAIEIVAQQCHAPGSVAIAPGGRPALGGIEFTILLVGPVLGLDKFRCQGYHPRLTGGDDHGGEGDVAVEEVPIPIVPEGLGADEPNRQRLGAFRTRTLHVAPLPDGASYFSVMT